MNILDWAVRMIEGRDPQEPIDFEEGDRETDFPDPGEELDDLEETPDEALELHQPDSVPVLIATPSFNQGVPTDHLNYYIDRLKKGHLLLLNLRHMAERDRDRARRIVDQMEGAVLALDGRVEDIDEHVFLFAPSRAEIEIDDHTQMV